jgi:hypothetical protein
MQMLQDDYDADPKKYQAARTRGLTRKGIVAMVNRIMFGGASMAKPDLNTPGICHTPLGLWVARTRDPA